MESAKCEAHADFLLSDAQASVSLEGDGYLVGLHKAEHVRIDNHVRSLEETEGQRPMRRPSAQHNLENQDRVRTLEGSAPTVQDVVRSLGQRIDRVELARAPPVPKGRRAEAFAAKMCAEISELHNRTQALMQGDMLQTEELRKQKAEVTSLQESLQRVLSKDILRGEEFRSLEETVSELMRDGHAGPAQNTGNRGNELRSLTKRVDILEDGSLAAKDGQAPPPKAGESVFATFEGQLSALWSAVKQLQNSVSEICGAAEGKETEKPRCERWKELEDVITDLTNHRDTEARIENVLFDELSAHRAAVKTLQESIAEQARTSSARMQEFAEQATSVSRIESLLAETIAKQQSQSSTIQAIEGSLNKLAALEDGSIPLGAEVRKKAVEEAVEAASEAAATAAASAVQEEEEHVVGLLEAHRLQVRRAFKILEDRMSEVAALSDRGSLDCGEERSQSHFDLPRRSPVDGEKETALLDERTSSTLAALTERVAHMEVELGAECEWLRGEVRVLAERSSGLLDKHRHRDGEDNWEGLGADDMNSSTDTGGRRLVTATPQGCGGGAGACNHSVLAERVQHLIREQRLMTEFVGQRSMSSASSLTTSEPFASWPAATATTPPSTPIIASPAAGLLASPAPATTAAPATVAAAVVTAQVVACADAATTRAAPSVSATAAAEAPTTALFPGSTAAPINAPSAQSPTTAQTSTPELRTINSREVAAASVAASTAVSRLLAEPASQDKEARDGGVQPKKQQQQRSLLVMQPGFTSMKPRGARIPAPKLAQQLQEEEIEVEFNDIGNTQGGNGKLGSLDAEDVARQSQPSEHVTGVRQDASEGRPQAAGLWDALLSSVSGNGACAIAGGGPSAAITGAGRPTLSRNSSGSSSSSAQEVPRASPPAGAMVTCGDITIGGFDSSEEWPEVRLGDDVTGKFADITAARGDGAKNLQQRPRSSSSDSSSTSSSDESQLDTPARVHRDDVDMQFSAIQDQVRFLDESLGSHAQASADQRQRFFTFEAKGDSGRSFEGEA
eukprot:TRINITY_DN13330_c0_g1_i4.p1 TRINITY_DN13330_c0_g1~~TRINITY_DN13330_c0_g1_i4.p1  ORF type:complete len:1022 (-),score=263.27 TRINITY_DN13330_c0_g1_i4:26-3091(-)